MNTNAIELLDTFPDFISIWDQLQTAELCAVPDIWMNSYMKQYPELLQKQINAYESEGNSWRKVALEHVFPFIAERFPKMKEAHDNIHSVLEPVLSQCRDVLDFSPNLAVVVYVGIGCGAGWATQYGDRPALLLGLENIAECNWHSKELITGLLSHELGHLYHDQERRDLDQPEITQAYWIMYREGFAQRCEHLVAASETWHPARGINNDDWLEWCISNQGKLADMYLNRVKNGKPVNDFFGHWFAIEERRQTGYYLGHEFIRDLEYTEMSIRQIAMLDEVENRAERFLKRIAGHSV